MFVLKRVDEEIIEGAKRADEDKLSVGDLVVLKTRVNNNNGKFAFSLAFPPDDFGSMVPTARIFRPPSGWSFDQIKAADERWVGEIVDSSVSSKPQTRDGRTYIVFDLKNLRRVESTTMAYYPETKNGHVNKGRFMKTVSSGKTVIDCQIVHSPTEETRIFRDGETAVVKATVVLSPEDGECLLVEVIGRKNLVEYLDEEGLTELPESIVPLPQNRVAKRFVF